MLNAETLVVSWQQRYSNTRERKHRLRYVYAKKKKNMLIVSALMHDSSSKQHNRNRAKKKKNTTEKHTPDLIILCFTNK